MKVDIERLAKLDRRGQDTVSVLQQTAKGPLVYATYPRNVVKRRRGSGLLQGYSKLLNSERTRRFE